MVKEIVKIIAIAKYFTLIETGIPKEKTLFINSKS